MIACYNFSRFRPLLAELKAKGYLTKVRKGDINPPDLHCKLVNIRCPTYC